MTADTSTIAQIPPTNGALSRILLYMGVPSLSFSAVIPILLKLLGFTSIGPTAGTVAATWQAYIGPVASGSLFAWCQSLMMGGFALTMITWSGLAGATLTAVGAATKWLSL